MLDITEVRAVVGLMTDDADERGSMSDADEASTRSAGLGKVLKVDPRDVYLRDKSMIVLL